MIKRISCLLLAGISIPVSAGLATPIHGPHLWLSTDPNAFDEGGLGYVEGGNGWSTDSYVTDDPFTLYVYHPTGEPAVDIGLMIAVHDGETGSVTVDGNVISSFPLVDFTLYYGGGNHGVYIPHDGVFATYETEIDLLADTNNSPSVAGALADSWTSFDIELEGFSQIHIDAFSTNGFWNPPSHDVTTRVVPEPATMVLMGTGLTAIVAIGRHTRKRRPTPVRTRSDRQRVVH